ncbi:MULTISPECIES: CarD family transcriptional regulator [Bacillus]|jgi:RNA polymerase-interacting CarD/CdnL/TRCF family regulator|uniref:Transcription factor YdeB n=1 Tax=Bacillus toyonensis TaxID=155322 RepID=A0A2B5Y4M3_9BACI|nr:MULTISPECIES: CarD family transcriptional regulator [Bacillus]AFU15416.1 Transcriptional regulator, CarD [Bacillus thuringiensis MC28]EEL20739.1 Transcriptional regulator, CarD [Bacillus cereus Rock1-3]EEL32289.1 Transcriptional regulator, CarD [Bacillus cereus Rock3-28]EEL38122.1 Transcriptional regulator, CarD [Bacillus cereus Rock3-29]KAB0446999.1 transcription factor YdeB [Lysinibacillus sp. VIA-II-2016]OTW78452.1 transcription factor YdeB [Bacillus thuringiensis serovar cameroun]OTX0
MEVDDLFQIGDKIVYPMHGAGIIEAIEEKEILGTSRQYCVIRILSKDMQVMLPMDQLQKSGIRYIVDKGTLNDILLEFQNGESDPSLSWKQRYTMNMEKMKNGNLQDSAEVVRDLLRRNKERALNASEKQMLDNARKMMISEVALVQDVSEHQATEFLQETINH